MPDPNINLRWRARATKEAIQEVWSRDDETTYLEEHEPSVWKPKFIFVLYIGLQLYTLTVTHYWLRALTVTVQIVIAVIIILQNERPLEPLQRQRTTLTSQVQTLWRIHTVKSSRNDELQEVKYKIFRVNKELEQHGDPEKLGMLVSELKAEQEKRRESLRHQLAQSILENHFSNTSWSQWRESLAETFPMITIHETMWNDMAMDESKIVFKLLQHVHQDHGVFRGL